MWTDVRHFTAPGSLKKRCRLSRGCAVEEENVQLPFALRDCGFAYYPPRVSAVPTKPYCLPVPPTPPSSWVRTSATGLTGVASWSPRPGGPQTAGVIHS